MELPCITCYHKKVREDGHRKFYGCKDAELKEIYFVEDDFMYHHTCNAYVKEVEGQPTPKQADDVCPKCGDAEYRNYNYCPHCGTATNNV